MSDDQEEVTLSPGPAQEVEADPYLERLVRSRQALESLETARTRGVRGGGEDWDAPFDLRVMRPRAVDLVKLWTLWGKSVPDTIAATLGPRRPILLNHVVTPFAKDGHAPGGVCSLGYEIVLHGVDANTVSVVPNDEVLKIGKVGEKVELGLDLGGSVSIPGAALGTTAGAAAFSLQSAKLRAAAGFDVQFAVELSWTLRKVLGAPVGEGGAQWKMYRQDEPLDRPHSLLQTLVVSGGDTMRCTIKTWATKAGFLGTRFGAKFWAYEDQEFTISLAGLSG